MSFHRVDGLRIFRAACFTLLPGIALPGAGVAQNQLGIEVRLSSDGQHQEDLQLSIPDGHTRGELRVLLSNVGDEDHTSLKLTTLMGGVAFAPASGSAGAAFDLPAGGPPVVVTITATRSSAGTEVGEILALGERLARLTVEKPTPTPVSLGGIGTDGLVVETPFENLRHPLRLTSTVSEDTQVTLTAESFTAPNHTTVQPTLEFEGAATTGPVTIAVPGGTSIPVTLQLDAPMPGVYQGWLVLDLGDVRRDIPVRVTRTRVASTVVFDSIAAARWNALLRADERLRFNIRETAGQTATLDRLSVVRIWKKEESGDFEADYEEVGILLNGASIPEPWEIGPGETLTLTLGLVGLLAPGRFEAKLRLESNDGEPVETIATIFVRRPMAFFIVLILITVLASHRVRQVVEVKRPLLVERARLARAAEGLKRFREGLENVTETEHEVLDAIAVSLRELLEWAQDQRPSDFTSRLEFVELKLRLVLRRWVELRRRATAANNDDATAELDKVEAYLRRAQPDGTPQADADAQIASLRLAEDFLREAQSYAGQFEDSERRTYDGYLQMPSAKRIRHQLREYEATITATALLVSVMIGLQLLYVGEYAWGDTRDIVEAVLWGLGLHQVGGRAFGGIREIKREFGLS